MRVGAARQVGLQLQLQLQLQWSSLLLVQKVQPPTAAAEPRQ